MHFKGDGNGGYVVSKGVMAFLVLIVTLLSVVCSVIAYGVTIRNDVDRVKSDVNSISGDVSILQEKGTKLRLDSETQWSVISSKLERIEEDIKEIKLDVKKILEE